MSPIASVSFMTHPRVYENLLLLSFDCCLLTFNISLILVVEKEPNVSFPSLLARKRLPASRRIDKSLFNESDNPFLEAHPRWHRFPIYRDGGFISNESRVFESKTELLLLWFCV